MNFYKYYILSFFLLFVWYANAQNPQLAKKYLEDGDFEKAVQEYQLLVDKFPYKDEYLFNLIRAYQALSEFDQVTSLLKKRKPEKNPRYWVYLGYNYQLQKDTLQAHKYYKKAFKVVSKRPYYAYAVGDAFKNLYLLDEAIETYRIAMQNGKNNFYMQLALIYAEKNEPDKMIENFLKLIENNDTYQSRIKYYLSKYITQDPENKTNIILKNQLVQKLKDTHKTSWYRLLQWLYTQQKEYKKAFLQLKSLYRKKEASMGEIYHLANTALFDKKEDEARDIYQYIIDENKNPQYVELSKLALLKIQLKKLLNDEEKQNLQKQFQVYLNQNWSKKNAVDLQILYADFLAFHNQQSDQALQLLDDLIRRPLNKKQKAEVLLKKADVLLNNEFFNQALILYTQVQLDFPNNPTGHRATYDLARASFFKGDIDWAHSQLKVIKSVASDLVANDALELDLIIINNKEENDTLQTGLKTFARAKFEIFRKNPDTALKILDTLKNNFKGQLIYDDALWEQAKIYERQKQFDKALENYQAIIDNKTEDLLIDDALYKMALIYEEQGDEELAKKLFKKILIEYPASFWIVDARKHFRKLRGDEVVN